MSLLIDRKFVSLIGTKLEKFSQKNDYLWNFRCPICGDSKKNKIKTRGYLYEKKSNIFFICHNCSSSMSFGNFLKQMDNFLYRQYQLERYKDESSGNVAAPDFSIAKAKPVFNKINLPTIESLNDDHIAKQYVINRKIPKKYWDKLYYADDFKQFVAHTFPQQTSQLVDKDKRLIIPFYDEKNIFLGMQGRSLSNSKVKYITLKSSEDSKKIFGLNHVNFNKTIYVVEGPIDSMFLTNSLAVMDAGLHSIIKIVGDHDYVFVYDNEPRNKQIVKHMEKTIAMGKKICVWPENISCKDVNDMILNGISVEKVINKNTFSGLKAKLQFQMWRKCN